MNSHDDDSRMTLSDFNDSWNDITPIPPGPPPEGSYRARVSKLEPAKVNDVTPCLRVTFELVDPPYAGKSVSYLVRFANPYEAKGTLQLVGLENVKPGDLDQFSAFETLPLVRIRVKHRESDGEIYANVVRIEPLPGNTDGASAANGATKHA